MNKIRVDEMPNGKGIDLTIRFGDQFQTVSIMAKDEPRTIADKLHELAEHVGRMASPFCGTCLGFKRTGGEYGWRPRNKITVSESSSCCTDYHAVSPPEPALDPSCCGNCSLLEYAHVEEGHGWCRVSTGSAHKNDVPCTYYQRKDTES